MKKYGDFVIVHMNGLCPKGAKIPHQHSEPSSFAAAQGFCKELGKRPLHALAPFLVTEALGSSEGEVWFSQVRKEETPLGTCQQPSIIMLNLRFELRHL